MIRIATTVDVGYRKNYATIRQCVVVEINKELNNGSNTSLHLSSGVYKKKYLASKCLIHINHYDVNGRNVNIPRFLHSDKCEISFQNKLHIISPEDMELPHSFYKSNHKRVS